MPCQYTPRQLEAFWKRVDQRGDDECWPWLGAHSPHGYGVFWVHDTRKNLRAHRVMYTIHHGDIPDGLVICHACDNPNCVNPRHLSAATQFENIQDRNRKGRQAHGPNAPKWKRPPKKGPLRGERANRSRLTQQQAEEILRRYQPRDKRNGAAALAREFGVDRNSILNIASGRTWSHLHGRTR